jgi:hypothetical protein
VKQRVRHLYPDYSGRLWTVTPHVLDELHTLDAHPDLPKGDYSSPALLRFWLSNGASMPLLAIIAQIGLVTPIVTTVVENTFGVLGVSACLKHIALTPYLQV